MSQSDNSKDYRVLGGWLLAIVIAHYVMAGLLAIDAIIRIVNAVQLMNLLSMLGVSGGVLWVIIPLVLVISGCAIGYSIVFANMIRKRDPMFLSIYHYGTLGILLLEFIVQLIVGSISIAGQSAGVGPAILVVIFGLIGIALGTLYFVKSQRVHVYMGDDRYIELSPFTKWLLTQNKPSSSAKTDFVDTDPTDEDEYKRPSRSASANNGRQDDRAPQRDDYGRQGGYAQPRDDYGRQGGYAQPRDDYSQPAGNSQRRDTGSQQGSAGSRGSRSPYSRVGAEPQSAASSYSSYAQPSASQYTDHQIFVPAYQRDRCCVCNRVLNDGYAVIFTNEAGEEARIDESCHRALADLANSQNHDDIQRAINYFRDAMPYVAPETERYLQTYIDDAERYMFRL